MRIEHTLPSDLLRHRAVRVLIIGAGGTGSAIVMGLPYLDQAMRVWGHRDGLEVVMMDADTVTETNCVRQPFSASDVGQNKATVLINRINMFWGTNWSAIPNHFHARSFDRNQDRCPDLLIGCVDTRAARKAIEDSFSRALSRTCYWLDLGNNAASGQYILGQPLNARNRRKAGRLRTISELYPGDRRRRSRRGPLAKLFGGRSSRPAGAVHQPDACCQCVSNVGATLPVWQTDPSRCLFQCEDWTDECVTRRSEALVDYETTSEKNTTTLQKDLSFYG